jgi:hypothetical protein
MINNIEIVICPKCLEYDGHKPEDITRLFSLEIDIDE